MAILFCLILVVYLGHGIFHPVAFFKLSPNQFLGEVLSYRIEEHLRKKVVYTPLIVARVPSHFSGERLTSLILGAQGRFASPLYRGMALVVCIS